MERKLRDAGLDITVEVVHQSTHLVTWSPSGIVHLASNPGRLVRSFGTWNTGDFGQSASSVRRIVPGVRVVWTQQHSGVRLWGTEYLSLTSFQVLRSWQSLATRPTTTTLFVLVKEGSGRRLAEGIAIRWLACSGYVLSHTS
ncbi:hypothetical protein VFPPC_16592 [Pochonia chlamydosporia 170]|uniref:Uncharacterized protein n=1 Tax=Pochonia chlamydosporia 170 TaxID=1380566 RepID=A0A179F912_METCM|nr:hypothetical protein VFPPC_16592 [Pochonia chlamydosporia 170]OAQ62005.1 hypothetical protein VFPPC_16592 [Pochonia chlamydosporia 170]